MENIEVTTQKIGEIRQLLQDLIKERLNLLDPEVVTASQKLDDALNSYENMIKKADK